MKKQPKKRKSKFQHSNSSSPTLDAGAGKEERLNERGRNIVNKQSGDDRVRSRSPALDLDEAYLAGQHANNTSVSGASIGASFIGLTIILTVFISDTAPSSSMIL